MARFDEGVAGAAVPLARDAAEGISVTLGSLLDEDQGVLGELGLLPGWHEEEEEEDEEDDLEADDAAEGTVLRREEARVRGAPWFEELVEGGRLGRVTRRRGGHTSGGRTVEWEVVEVETGEDHAVDTPGSGLKRKGEHLGREEAEGEDVQMR